MKKFILVIVNFFKGLLSKSRQCVKSLRSFLVKFMKGYFCFFSNEIGTLHFGLFVVLFFASCFFFELESFFVLMFYVFLICLGHAIIVLVVRVLYISYVDSEDSADKFCHFVVLKNGEVKSPNFPVWGKGVVYAIKGLNKSTNKKIIFKTDIEYNSGSTIISVPMKVTWYLSGRFDKLELFNVLRVAQPKETTLDLGVYAVNIVDTNDLGKIIRAYMYNEILCVDFLDKAANAIVFSKNPLSNVANVIVKIEEPSFFACK